MRMHIFAVGKLKKTPERALVEDFTTRAVALGRNLGLQISGVKEFPESTAASVTLRKADEGKRVLAALPQAAIVVVLDENGTDLTSRKLAKFVRQHLDSGVGDVVFVLGGPDGHGPALLQHAKLSLAMGRLTWPHRLARVMMAEQLYRIVTILSNHPYHRD